MKKLRFLHTFFKYPTLLFCSLIFLATGLNAQEDPEPAQNTTTQREAAIARANRFLKMDDAKAKAYSAKLTPLQARALMSQLLNLKRSQNPELDRIVVLIQHLDNIRASELAQARLDKLFIVIAMVLMLFSIYLLVLLIDQRRTLKDMQHLVKNSQKSAPGQKQADTEIFRG